MTIKLDQISDAILNAPGGAILALSFIPGGNIDTTSTSFVDITESTGSFSVAVAGTYTVIFCTQCFLVSGSAESTNFRLVIDAGTGSEQIVGPDDATWRIFHNEAGEQHPSTMATTVNLTSGGHTIKTQWRRSAGSNTHRMDGNDYTRVLLVGSGGSGAGGSISNRTTRATNLTVSGTITPDARQEVTELTQSISTVAGESVLAVFNGLAYYDQAGPATITCYASLYIDSSLVQETTVNIDSNGDWANLNFSYVTTSLTAGSHIFVLKVSRATSSQPTWTLSANCRLDTFRFRGGLIPIQKDGTDIVTSPRALNFQGSAVTIDSTTNVANIRLNEALTTPTQTVMLINNTVSSTRTTTSSSFSDIDANLSATITIPYTGTYQLQLNVGGLYDPSAGCEVRFAVLVDSVIVTTNDKRWEGSLAPSRENFSCQEPATLTAGSHTFKLQWKRSSGVGTVTADTVCHFTLQAFLLTGSGAGGILTSTSSTSGNVSVSTVSPTWTDVYTLSEIVCSNTESIQFSVSSQARMDSGGTIACMQLRLYDTSTSLVIGSGPVATSTSLTEYQNLSYVVCPSLALGSHIVKLQATATSAGTSPWTVNFANTCVTRFRGGLVPVQKDGALILDKPSAFDFTGSGVQVTNIGGTAKVSLVGAGGSIEDPAFFSYQVGQQSWSVFSGNYSVGGKFICKFPCKIKGATIYTRISGAHTIRARLWNTSGVAVRTIDISCSGPGWYRGLFDSYYDIAQADVGKIFTISQWHTAGTYCNEDDASDIQEGTIGIGKAYVAVSRSNYYAAGDAFPNSYASGKSYPVDPIIEVNGDPSGFVFPENIPILEYNSASVVNIKAVAGASTTINALLNNGARYTYNGTLTVNLTVSGLGGIDIGSEASSTWYYIYLVPSGVNGQLGAIASITAPTTGPTGYSVWRYIGAIRNDSSSNIIKFYQVENCFEYATNVQPIPFTGAGSADTSLQTLSLTSYIPATASQVHLGGYIQVNSAGTMYFFSDGDAIVTSSATRWDSSHSRLGGNAAAEIDHLNAWIPTTGTKQVGYFREVAYSQCRVDCFGWKDGFISNLTSQNQAQYTPDTKLSRLVYSSASAINIMPEFGQPTTSRLTFQDGKQRYYNGTLAWSFTNGVADLGLDTGTEASSTWYYMYAVPKSGDDSQFSVRASITSPITGPTGYTNFVYLGAFRNNSSSDIVKFYQSKNEFSFAAQQNVQDQSNPSSEASPVEVDLSSFVPATASSVSVFAKGYTPGGYCEIRWWAYPDSAGTPFKTWWCNTGDTNVNEEIPLPSTTKSIYQQRTDYSSGNLQYWLLYVNKWSDGYIGGFPTGAAQIQPQYTPDTKLPMLAYNDTASINISAAPGWPTTSRLTFQDGKQRFSNGTLAWSFANGVADLGLDTGTEASSTWYFMYAVPKSGDDSLFSVRASINPPATGPTGYTKFVYLGAFRNNASSNIIRFIQTGAFSFKYQSAKFLYNEAGPAPETTPGTLIDCSTYVPSTASIMWLFNNIAPAISANFEQWQCDWYPYTYASGDQAYTFVQGATHGYENQLQMLIDVPMPSSTKSVYRCVWRVSGTAASLSWHSASITGWDDQYLMK